MLPKSKRLTSSDFQGLRTRISYRSVYFDIARIPAPTSKYACIIAKKRIRRAVDRNRARRKIYEALRVVEPPTPSFVIVYPTKQAVSVNIKVLVEELRTAFATL